MAGEANQLQAALAEPIEETYHSILETRQWRGTKVVIKRCRNQDDPRTPVRFRDEVAALKVANDHNHVARILDSDASQLTIILRLEPGLSLDKHITYGSKSNLSHPECTKIWGQIAGALAYLHPLSIIHDDVKPDNIMWSSDEQRAVLIDFGAALIDMPPGYFNPSGTPNYAPPEFLQRKKSAKGDIWGLGITMLFAFGYVPLPMGEWILPVALNEGTEARKEMLAWLNQVDVLRAELAESRPLAAAMLDADPDARIDSAGLVRQLGAI